jgi:DNA invertase Pin-like site-specific DNA recombinase
MFEEIPRNCRYGYARVSSQSQENNSSLESQKEEFLQLGVPKKNIRIEVGSAADPIRERPVFQKLIEEELQENHILFGTKIDRCSRNTLEFLKLQEKLFQKQVTFISLDLPYSTDMAVNKLIATNLAAIATFENERRKERQRQGIEVAKKNGKYFGRKTVIDKKLISQVQNLKENKNLSITEISKITGRARNTIYKILKEELNYIPYNRLVKATKGENKVTFESERINVDSISLKILNLTNNYEIDKIREAFRKYYGYESYIVYQETEQKIKEKHSYSTENKIFLKHWKKPSWEGCIVCFPGLTGKHF